MSLVANPDPTDAAAGLPATTTQRRLQALYAGSGLPRVPGAAPRVAVIGAGLAGLVAAHLLRQGGCEPAVFEASGRTGGRIWTETDTAGQVWELGGEFIDSHHDDLFAMARHFGLPLLDASGPPEAALASVCHFGGQRYSDAQVQAAWAALAPRVAGDVATLTRRVARRRHSEADRRFDRLTIAQYLGSLDTEPWMRRLLEVAFVTVYGRDAGDQSAINLLSLIGTGSEFELFGNSDERYKLRDGSQRLTDALTVGLQDRIYLQHPLVRLRRRGEAHVLTLDRPSGAVEVEADFVVLALPFTLLRQVDLGDTLPPIKQRCIEQLQYGDNTKLMVGVQRRVWQELGFEGGSYSDGSFQTTWECSRRRGAEPAVFTYFAGGAEGRHVCQADPAALVQRYASQTDPLFPGFSAALTGAVRRVAWPVEPWALGSYTCYAPGQWTTIAGDEATPAGRVHFAGEHCATGDQGYMNGAAQTGRQAALAILRSLG